MNQSGQFTLPPLRRPSIATMWLFAMLVLLANANTPHVHHTAANQSLISYDNQPSLTTPRDLVVFRQQRLGGDATGSDKNLPLVPAPQLTPLLGGFSALGLLLHQNLSFAPLESSFLRPILRAPPTK
ncbi:hypothetical protein CA267_010040 [Alteromonas pelagimontana]|uniref:Uncharacterized protein n=1 Tax=Alteromonas pelagimontana TaxID=1858656 RepID=A0A6M4MD29_9ALTE|nr:hypothetical protein [Alteromonas pelagimontana]QJR81094.1 hypothetical protein CA267_010040 [Alteromonas pelagimontana]